jgi:phosphate starvation-inducible PhoH-like protein
LVLLDEVQNFSPAEFYACLTRVGENCRIIISGDFHQTDLYRDAEKKGVLQTFKILKSMKSVDFFEFKKEDIVRSKFVKEYIIAEAKYKQNNY